MLHNFINKWNFEIKCIEIENKTMVKRVWSDVEVEAKEHKVANMWDEKIKNLIEYEGSDNNNVQCLICYQMNRF
jgi:hypothetical protein